MKFTKLIISVFILSVCSFCFANPFDPVTIKQVISKLEGGKTPGQNFSLGITIKVTDHDVKNWAIGFYTPRTFNQLVNQSGTSVNPDLKMQLCESSMPGQCSDLQFVKANNTYLSAGYTNIVAPKDSHSELKSGKTYVIQLSNSNQWAPNNFSAMPQSFFLIENGFVAPLAPVSENAYVIDGYDEAKVNADIVQHNKNNWDNSIPRAANNLADQYHLVPTPVSVLPANDANFLLLQQQAISIADDFQDEDKNNHDFFQNYFHIKLLDSDINNAVIQIQKISLTNPEGYELKITSKNIFIRASSPAGVFYAMQTLRQLKNQDNAFPAVAIQDYPRFKYRGILLDVSRHYFAVNDIKKLIDVMAAQKLNTLHIHFADDEGWRIQIPAFPALTTLGSARGFANGAVQQPLMFEQANLDISNHEGFSPSGKLIQANYPKANELYKGYYSLADVNSLISYANARQITLIPEVDMPGHSRALIQSMPAVFKDPHDHSQFISVQGYTDDAMPVCLYHSEQDNVFSQTVNKIINQLGVMFADQSTLYHVNEISVGGDEVSSDVWTKDDSCSTTWQSLSALDKSHYFFSLLHRNVKPLFSGWQQFVQNDNGLVSQYAVPADQTAHVWVWETTGNGAGQKGIHDAAALINAGYPTVLAFADDTYFDLTYTPNKWEPGFSWAGSYLDTAAALHSANDANEVESLLQANQKDKLAGLEGTLWSENITNWNHLAYMVLPKMTGLAEAAWANKTVTTTVDGRMNWQSLSYRLGFDNNGFLGFIHQLSGVEYRGYPHGISPEVPVS